MGEDKDKLPQDADIEAHKRHGRDVTDEPDESRLEKKEDDDEGDDVEAHRRQGRD